MAIKGLIFDLDGTVALSQHFHAQAFGEVFKHHGLIFTPQDDARYTGTGAHHTFQEFFKEHGITLTQEQIEQYYQEKKAVYEELIKKSPMESVPGVKKFLEEQQKRGMKISMATGNSLEATKFILKEIRLENYFEHITTNKDVANPKPAPDIFLKAAQKMGLQPEECIVFEDAVNGVKAAKSAGMNCIGLETTTPKEKLLGAGADMIVKDYTSIEESSIS